MARFYQTAPRNFIDDFIFQPNWQMASMALQKTDTEIKDQLNTLDLFNNLPVDFWSDADRNNVNQIKDEYSTRVDELTKQMQGDLTNTGNNRYLINQLRKDIERDYETGRIKQIQDNAKAYRDFTTKLAELPNPADRQAYMGAVKQYLANNEKGALSSLFKAPEMYNMQDVWKGFTESAGFKSLEPDAKASQITNSNGRYLVTQGNETKELSESKIGKAFLAYVNGANLQGYAADRQKYHGQQWLDQNGNYRFDGDSYLGNIIETGIPSLAYRNESASKGMAVDQYGMLNAQEQMQIRAEKREQYRKQQEAKDMPPELSKNASFAAKVAGSTVDIVNGQLEELGKKYGLKLNTNNLDELISWSKKNGKGTFAQELVNLKTNLNEGLRASYEPLYYMGFNKSYVEAFKKNVQSGITNKGYNVRGYADFAGAGLDTTAKMSKNASPNEMIGKTIGGRKIMNVSYIKDSSFPVFFGTSDLVNQVQSTLKIDFEPADGLSEESNTRFVDFYQPSKEITGDNTIKQDILNSRN